MAFIQFLPSGAVVNLDKVQLIRPCVDGDIQIEMVFSDRTNSYPRAYPPIYDTRADCICAINAIIHRIVSGASFIVVTGNQPPEEWEVWYGNSR